MLFMRNVLDTNNFFLGIHFKPSLHNKCNSDCLLLYKLFRIIVVAVDMFHTSKGILQKHSIQFLSSYEVFNSRIIIAISMYLASFCGNCSYYGNILFSINPSTMEWKYLWRILLFGYIHNKTN